MDGYLRLLYFATAALVYTALPVLLCAAAIAVAYWLLRAYWGWRIRRWCRRRGFVLRAFSFTITWPWLLWDEPMIFHVVVEDRAGSTREGSLGFYYVVEPVITWDGVVIDDAITTGQQPIMPGTTSTNTE